MSNLVSPNKSHPVLSRLEQARQALAEAVTLGEKKQVRDIAKATADLIRQQKLGEEALLDASTLKLQAERAMGEQLKETVQHRGGKAEKLCNDGTALPKEVSRRQSSDWQKIAALPARKFETYVQHCRDNSKLPTTNEAVRLATAHVRDLVKAQRRAEALAEANGEQEQAEPDKPQRPKGQCEVQQGDSLELLSRLADGCIHLAFADPPYNIGIDYGQGAEADKRPPEVFHGWCKEWIDQAFRVLKPTGAFWVLINDENAAEIKLLLQAAGFTIRSWIKWYESFGVNCANNFNRTSRHLFYCVKNSKRFTFNPEAVNRLSDRQSKYNDKRANPDGKIWDDVWGYNPEIHRLNANAEEREPGFPTQLPLALLTPIVECSSDPEELVLDLFSGSATTGVVCLRSQRRFLGFELSEVYANESRNRLIREQHKLTRANK